MTIFMFLASPMLEVVHKTTNIPKLILQQRCQRLAPCNVIELSRSAVETSSGLLLYFFILAQTYQHRNEWQAYCTGLLLLLI